MDHSIDRTDDVLGRLHGVKKSGEGFVAFCPSHDDRHERSLKVTPADDGRVLLKCYAGCTFREVLAAIDLEAKDMFPKPEAGNGSGRTKYSVRDENGSLRAVHHRQNTQTGKKVWWTTAGGETGLGGMKTDSLPLWGCEAIPALDPSEPVVVCEGEKAAHALTSQGIAAVGTVTGASGTPSTDALRFLKGRPVILWPDNDDAGNKHMQRIGKILTKELGHEDVSTYRWEGAPEKGDAADHPPVTISELQEHSYRFMPPHDPATDGAGSFLYALEDYAKLRKLRRKCGGVTGIRTGIPKLDKGTHGLNRGYSYIIAARPNVGKSLLAGQIALTAAEQGHRVLLQTPEMSAVQYLDRFACKMAGVNYFKAQDGQITEVEDRKLSKAAELLANYPLLVDEYGGQPIERIRANVERHEPDLIVVDYLQYLEADDPRANRNQQVGQISRDLNRLKSDYNLPVVIAAQLNRSSVANGVREPMLSDLRDSGELEQDADMVMMIHRPDMTNPDVRDGEEEIQLLCRKNRTGGQIWDLSLYFMKGQNWLIDQTQKDWAEFSPEGGGEYVAGRL